MISSSSSVVHKEDIQGLSFSRKEVLTDPEAIRLRESQLRKACELGNSYQGKVRIQFQTTEGPREVQTTVWSFTGESISLKNGVWIPVTAIISVMI
jgi:hypothetical protein